MTKNIRMILQKSALLRRLDIKVKTSEMLLLTTLGGLQSS